MSEVRIIQPDQPDVDIPPDADHVVPRRDEPSPPQRTLESRRAVARAKTKQPDASLVARVRLRTATADDVPALVPLINDAYDFTEHHIFPGSRRTDRHDIAALVDGIAVAELDRRIVACIHIDLAGSLAHYGLLAVDVSLHRSGLGSMLVEHAEASARRVGHARIAIETVKQAGLIPFYKARGYRVIREHDGQTWNGGADWGASGPWQMVDMEKELR